MGEHYTGNIGYLTDKNWTCRAKIQGTKCEDWSDCYFKNWKRKEQECEELRKQWEFSVVHKIILEKDYNVELNKYKQALTEIKEIANYSFNLSTSELIAKLERILQKCEVINV